MNFQTLSDAAQYSLIAIHSALKQEQAYWDGWFWLSLGLLRSSRTITFSSASLDLCWMMKPTLCLESSGYRNATELLCNNASTGTASLGLKMLREGVWNHLQALLVIWDFQQDGGEAKSFDQFLLKTRYVVFTLLGRLRNWRASVCRLDCNLLSVADFLRALLAFCDWSCESSCLFKQW